MCPVLEKPVKNSSPKRSGSVIVNDNDDDDDNGTRDINQSYVFITNIYAVTVNDDDDDNGTRDINQSYKFITNIYAIFILCLAFFLTITLNLNSYTLQTCIYFNLFNFYFSCF